MIKILFICHGNICRSPMAEFVMKDIVKREGVVDKFVIASAATSTEEIGNDTYHGTKKVLREHGVPFSPRRARQLTIKDCQEYDYLIGMDEANVRNISRIGGKAAEGKIYKLLSFAGERGDVADPWYTGNFDKTYEDVTKGCEALFSELIGREM